MMTQIEDQVRRSRPSLGTALSNRALWRAFLTMVNPQADLHETATQEN